MRPYGDGLRVVATLAVVGIHSSGMVVTQYGTLPIAQWWSGNLVDSLCRWAVPVFIMLSGALMLDPARDEPWREFYRKRLRRVGIPLMVWAGFYFFWASFFLGEDVTRDFVVDNLYRGLTYNHLYFLLLILGLYAATPPLRMYVRRVGPPWQWVLGILALGLVASGIPSRGIPLNACTLFLPYVGYYVIGYRLAELRVDRVRLGLAAAGFLVSTIAIAVGTASRLAALGLNDGGALALYDSLNPLVMMQSMSVFLLSRGVCSRDPGGAGRRLTKHLAAAAFGIYLVHRVPLDVLHRSLGELAANGALAVISAEVVLAYTISAIAVLLVLRIPYARRTLGG